MIKNSIFLKFYLRFEFHDFPGSLVHLYLLIFCYCQFVTNLAIENIFEKNHHLKQKFDDSLPNHWIFILFSGFQKEKIEADFFYR